MVDYGSAGADGGHEGPFVDGVVDTYERVAAIHHRAPATKRDGTLELARFEDVVAVAKRRDVHSIAPAAAAIGAMASGAVGIWFPVATGGGCCSVGGGSNAVWAHLGLGVLVLGLLSKRRRRR